MKKFALLLLTAIISIMNMAAQTDRIIILILMATIRNIGSHGTRQWSAIH